LSSTLLISLPLTADRVFCGSGDNRHVLRTIALAAVILAPAHFGWVGCEVRASDVVVRDDFGAA